MVDSRQRFTVTESEWMEIEKQEEKAAGSRVYCPLDSLWTETESGSLWCSRTELDGAAATLCKSQLQLLRLRDRDLEAGPLASMSILRSYSRMKRADFSPYMVRATATRMRRDPQFRGIYASHTTAKQCAAVLDSSIGIGMRVCGKRQGTLHERLQSVVGRRWRAGNGRDGPG